MFALPAVEQGIFPKHQRGQNQHCRRDQLVPPGTRPSTPIACLSKYRGEGYLSDKVEETNELHRVPFMVLQIELCPDPIHYPRWLKHIDNHEQNTLAALHGHRNYVTY